MMSSRIVTSAVLIGFLAATPALAQNARARGDNGGDRGGDRGSARGGDRGGNRGGAQRAESPRTYQRNAPERAPAARSYDRSSNGGNRSYNSGRRDDAQRQYNAPRQYTAPRQYDARRNDSPRRYDAPRAYDYNRRSYTRPSYSRPGYAPRRDPYYRGGATYRGYNPRYYAPRYNYSRRYTYGGYRGYYGYGGSYLRSRIVTIGAWRPYHYRPRLSIGVFYGAGGVYDYGYTPSYYYDPIPGRDYGGVRITEAPRDAQVFADGYYVGIVDDFDGIFQHVNLEAGQHRIEVRAGDIEPISFDVYVQPGRTITLRADDYDDGYVDNGDGY